tara:strand:- start:2122 stop:2502 length:381 start_codon:yes stop_codon:yes gene_type:complete
MKNNIVMQCLIIIHLLTSYAYAQTWDKNFYDKKILYENAESLQLTEYQKNKILYEIGTQNNHKTFYNVDNYLFNDNVISIKKEEIYKKKPPLILFSEISHKMELNLKTTSNNIENATKNTYFINFK